MAKWSEDSAWKAGLTAALLGMMHARPGTKRGHGSARSRFPVYEFEPYPENIARLGAKGETGLGRGELAALAETDPAGFRDLYMSGPGPQIAYDGLANVRAGTATQLKRALIQGALVGPSSAVVPHWRRPMIGDGYQSGTGGVRLYLGPEWTIPDPRRRIITYLGDAYSSSTKSLMNPEVPPGWYDPETRSYVPEENVWFSREYGKLREGHATANEYRRRAARARKDFVLSMDRDLARVVANSFDSTSRLANELWDFSRDRDSVYPRAYHDVESVVAGVSGLPSTKRPALGWSPIDLPSWHFMRSDHWYIPNEDPGAYAKVLANWLEGRPFEARIGRRAAFDETHGDYRDLLMVPMPRRAMRGDPVPQEILDDNWNQIDPLPVVKLPNAWDVLGEREASRLRGEISEVLARSTPDWDLPMDEKYKIYSGLKKEDNDRMLALSRVLFRRGTPGGTKALPRQIYNTRAVDDLQNLVDPTAVLSLDQSRGEHLPANFYDWLGKHRYLENKVYNNIPIEDVRGIGIDRPSMSAEDYDFIRREADRHGIPHMPYHDRQSELEVQKTLAPVIHMDAKGGESADDLADFISELPPDDDLGDFIFENKL